MELNLTLGVQAVNFFCAYVIMRYFLFKPAMAQVEAEREYRGSLEAAIVDRKIVVEQKALEREERWKSCQHKLVQQEPPRRTLEERVMLGLTPAMQVPEVSDRDITEAVERSVETLQKIGDLS